MRIIWQVQVAVLALTLAACTQIVEVRSTFGPNVDFEHYETFTFAPVESRNTGDPRLDDPRLGTQIEAAITRHLNDHGFRYVMDDPDLVVNYHAAISRDFDQTQVDNIMFEHGSGITTSTEFETGSLIIIIFDAREGKAVWGASMQAELNEKASRSQRRKRLDGVLDDMFAKFTKEEYIKHKEAEAAADK